MYDASVGCVQFMASLEKPTRSRYSLTQIQLLPGYPMFSFPLLHSNFENLVHLFTHNKMAINCVHLESDAFMLCLTHALSTEREEVMGLLIGEVS